MVCTRLSIYGRIPGKGAADPRARPSPHRGLIQARRGFLLLPRVPSHAGYAAFYVARRCSGRHIVPQAHHRAALGSQSSWRRELSAIIKPHAMRMLDWLTCLIQQMDKTVQERK